MSQPRVLSVSYLVWEGVAQANGWATFHTTLAGTTVITTGDLDHLFVSRISGADATDWAAAFPSSIPVVSEDDAQALIIGQVVKSTPRDPQDGKQVVVVSPATEGWNTWLMGAGDDLAPTPPATGRGEGTPFCLEFTLQEVLDAAPDPAVKVLDFAFSEELEIHDGQVCWSQPGVQWDHTDSFSLGVHIPATTVTPNVTTEGNCHVVDAQGNPGAPDATHYIIVPAAGDGTYDVDLAQAIPVPAQGGGFWDCSYDGGIITPSALTGAAEFHLLTVPVTSWLARNITMLHPGGWWDIDVYKTEWFHRRWKLRWEVKKKTQTLGVATGWVLGFRRNTT